MDKQLRNKLMTKYGLHSDAVDEIMALFDAQKLDPFDFVQPCEPECTPERHAYHEGQWHMATRIQEAQGEK